MATHKYSRRDFLKISGAAAATLALTACSNEPKDPLEELIKNAKPTTWEQQVQWIRDRHANDPTLDQRMAELAKLKSNLDEITKGLDKMGVTHNPDSISRLLNDLSEASAQEVPYKQGKDNYITHVWTKVTQEHGLCLNGEPRVIIISVTANEVSCALYDDKAEELAKIGKNDCPGCPGPATRIVFGTNNVLKAVENRVRETRYISVLPKKVANIVGRVLGLNQ